MGLFWDLYQQSQISQHAERLPLESAGLAQLASSSGDQQRFIRNGAPKKER